MVAAFFVAVFAAVVFLPAAGGVLFDGVGVAAREAERGFLAAAIG
ncbi:MAG TPA: hypothetical protein VI916_03085 [Acidimicrobiia bacterium]|nr:hypothetical protein [Acidimicrobiia bacterium]